MATIKRVIKAYVDYFTKGDAGDAGLVEAELYGIGLNSQVEAKLQDFIGYYPTINLEQLSQLPEGTLGYEYAQHMQECGIQPLEISQDLQKEADKNPFALRYIVTHDIFHILLGFDVSYAGEVGVFAFTVGQNYSKMLNLIYPLVLLISCIIAPTQIKKTFANNRRGKILGKQAECLLVYRFEENWARPIEDIRKELGLVLEGDELDTSRGSQQRGSIAA
ncbi:MAG: Coq4 family protein [Cyanobacteria bacterium J06628_3]